MATNNKYEYTLPVGTILTSGQHSYKVVEVLGQGGFGITYKVSAQVMMGNIPVNVFFAVKEHFVKGHCYRGSDEKTMEYSKASKSEVEESLEDFKKEANRLKDICKWNKNVVNVNEVFFSNNTAYYVMEYIDGGDLRKLILDNKGGISEQEALSIIIPIANAVSYIHQQGIMHLDIKPDNIVIRNNTKEPVLIDFGVSLHFNKKGELTTTHVSTGASAGFAPQEQFAGITRFAPEVDVYALAATFFYLLVGRDPKSAFDIKEGDIEKALSDTVSEKTREAIVLGMKKEGYQRTQTVKDFVAALHGEYQEQSVVTPLPANYILHLGATDYLIIRTQEIGNCYIKYQAVRYAGQYDGPGSNMTIKKTYPLYEFFAKGVHERQKDNSVIEGNDSSKARKDFSALSYKIIGEGSSETYKADSHVFKTNGTFYFVEEKKPVPSIPIWRYAKYLIGVCVVAISVGVVIKMCSTTSITQDSPLTEDIIGNIVIPSDSNDMTVPVKNLSKEEQAANPVKEEKVKDETDKKDVAKDKIKSTSPENDESRYQEAVSSNNSTIFKELAEKGYVKAYSKVANIYLKEGKYSYADSYARRALSSGYGKKEAINVIEILDGYGYYDNGEHGVKPKY